MPPPSAPPADSPVIPQPEAPTAPAAPAPAPEALNYADIAFLTSLGQNTGTEFEPDDRELSQVPVDRYIRFNQCEDDVEFASDVSEYIHLTVNDKWHVIDHNYGNGPDTNIIRFMARLDPVWDAATDMNIFACTVDQLTPMVYAGPYSLFMDPFNVFKDTKWSFDDDGESGFGVQSNASGQIGELVDEVTVVKGDSLWHIASHADVYNDATKWQAIYEANKNIIQNADLIYPGQVLKIPRDE